MSYFLRRAAFLLLTLWVAVTLNFLIPRLMPGNPAASVVSKLTGKGQGANPEALRAVEAMLGMPEGNLFQQYGQYLSSLVRGDFGVSYAYFPYSVLDMIAGALLWTLALIGVTTILAFIIGTTIGAFAAWRRSGLFDSVATLAFTFAGTLPFFWVGLIGLYFLGFVLGWFPLSGGYDGSLVPGWNVAFVGSVLSHSILPATAILITSPVGWIMGMRNNMIHVLGEDFTRLAQAKGLKSRVIALNYGARNAILPNITAFAIALGHVVGGSLLVEVVFGYPGMGNLLFKAVSNQDYPLMQAIFLLITIGVLLANFAADMLYGWLDPRVRRGSEA